ncbi:MAG: hypothetical protein D6782_01480, partial [Alphaproteobacteria bacterium]
MAATSSNAVRTTCPYCGVGCGVLAMRAANGGVTIAGDPDHPAGDVGWLGRLADQLVERGETGLPALQIG